MDRKKTDLLESQVVIVEPIEVPAVENLDQVVDQGLQTTQSVEPTVVQELSLLQKTKFKAVLSVYSTKNNVFWTLTDVTGKNMFFKRSGGMECKRGTDKNSQKVATKNLEYVLNVVEALKIDLLFIKVRNGVRNRKSPVTSKFIQKLVTTLKVKNCTVFQSITNSTRVAVSKTTIKGGRRGRRT